MPISEGRFRGFIDQDDRNDLHPNAANNTVYFIAACVFNEIHDAATGKWVTLGANAFRQFVRVLIQKKDGMPHMPGYDQLGKVFGKTGPQLDAVILDPIKWAGTGVQTTFEKKPNNKGQLYWENGFVNPFDHEGGPAILDDQTRMKTRGIVARLRAEMEARAKAQSNPGAAFGATEIPVAPDDLPY